jgi:hypothetical protein
MAYTAMKRVLMVKLDKGFRNSYLLVNIGSFYEKTLAVWAIGQNHRLSSVNESIVSFKLQGKNTPQKRKVR